MSEIQKLARYFMVHNSSGAGSPNKVHLTRESAAAEAQRLAKQSRGHYFTVLEAVDCYVSAEPPIVRVDVVTRMEQEGVAPQTATHSQF